MNASLVLTIAEVLDYGQELTLAPDLALFALSMVLLILQQHM